MIEQVVGSFPADNITSKCPCSSCMEVYQYFEVSLFKLYGGLSMHNIAGQPMTRNNKPIAWLLITSIRFVAHSDVVSSNLLLGIYHFFKNLKHNVNSQLKSGKHEMENKRPKKQNEIPNENTFL